MKRMSKKEFGHKYVTGIKNCIRNRSLTYHMTEIEFCPEHRALEFMLPFKFQCYMVYDKTNNKTRFFMMCVGFVNLGYNCSLYNDKEGIMLTFSGDRTKDSTAFTESILKNERFLNLLREEYYAYKSNIDAA